MQHTDEHTIELYILGSELVKEETAEIEAHLKECHGCRALAEQIETFYRTAEENIDKLPKPTKQKTKALTRLPKDLMGHDIPLGSRVPYKPATAIAKLFYFVYRHPIPSAVSGFVAIAAMVLGINYAVTDFMKDKNPAYPHINPSNATVEIYNKENQLLWNFPSNSTYMLSGPDLTSSEKKIIVTDLNGDNKNEVVTILQTGKPTYAREPVTIFSSPGGVVKTISFDDKVQFRTSKYSEQFNPSNILCDDFGDRGIKELLVVASCSRSPNILNRISNDGEVLGQYYHFGFGQIATINIMGKHYIAYYGQNNVDETDSLSYPVLCILDPMKIIGKTEASDSRGFGFPVSDAELLIIRFPLSDMNYAWKTLGNIYRVDTITIENARKINVWVCGAFKGNGVGNGNDPIFEYIFDEQFKIADIKFNSETNRLRMQFVSAGALIGKVDSSYLANLKSGIRFWNGKSWQNEWTRVKHQP